MKIAVNLDLILSDDGKCPAFLKSSGIIDLGAFCVELWSFYVSKRISVPMSYISFFYCSYIVSFVVKSPSGAKIHEKHQMRIQEGHFLKIALNLDLTLSDDGECRTFLIRPGIIDLGAFCVELWPFFVSKGISVPM